MLVAPLPRMDLRPAEPLCFLALQHILVGRTRILQPELQRRLYECALFGLARVEQVGLAREPVYDVELTPQGRRMALAVAMLHDGAGRSLAPEDVTAAATAAGWACTVNDAIEVLRLLSRARLARRSGGQWVAAMPQELAL